MPKEALGRLSKVRIFRGQEAVHLGISRKELTALVKAGVVVRELPDTYRMAALPRTNEIALRAALLWAGDDAAGAGESAGEVYRLEGVRAARPEIASSRDLRSPDVITHRCDPAAIMIRTVRGIRVTGVEPTLVALAASLDAEAFEIACEDARRRQLTSVPALRAYLRRYGKAGRPGVGSLRSLLDELDPVHPSRSTLEVKTRRLLVANGITDFVREFPLQWNGKTYFFDFTFQRTRTILETNGRRWHDDASDFEHDNEKWSVPARHGYRIVFATWNKVTRCPQDLITELRAALTAEGGGAA